MPNGNLREAHEQDQAPVMPAELQPLMQALLATLADIDFAHEHELDRVNSGAATANSKAKMIAKLGQLHGERRQPYAQELLRLEDRIRSLLGSGSG